MPTPSRKPCALAWTKLYSIHGTRRRLPLNSMSNCWLCSELSTTSHSHSRMVRDGRKIITPVSVRADWLCGMHMLHMMFLQLATDSWHIWSFPRHCWAWLWSLSTVPCVFSVFIQSHTRWPYCLTDLVLGKHDWRLCIRRGSWAKTFLVQTPLTKSRNNFQAQLPRLYVASVR